MASGDAPCADRAGGSAGADARTLWRSLRSPGPTPAGRPGEAAGDASPVERLSRAGAGIRCTRPDPVGSITRIVRDSTGPSDGRVPVFGIARARTASSEPGTSAAEVRRDPSGNSRAKREVAPGDACRASGVESPERSSVRSAAPAASSATAFIAAFAAFTGVKSTSGIGTGGRRRTSAGRTSSVFQTK